MLDFRKNLINSTLNKVLKRLHYPLEVMVTCVRWYVAYPLSLRHVEELMHERGVFVDHFTVHRWAIKMLPVLAAVFRKRKRSVGSSWWRMDETYKTNLSRRVCIVLHARKYQGAANGNGIRTGAADVLEYAASIMGTI